MQTEKDLQEELILDLTKELEAVDENFNASLLLVKVTSAIREVKKTRNYPDYYTDEQIGKDLYRFYANCRNLALYDYNQSGAEFQTSSSENGVSRVYMERNKMFSGIIPLSR